MRRFGQKPNYLRQFRCLCYPYTRPYNTQLEAQISAKCVFGLILITISAKCAYLSRHVKFYESVFSFSKNTSIEQGRPESPCSDQMFPHAEFISQMLPPIETHQPSPNQTVQSIDSSLLQFSSTILSPLSLSHNTNLVTMVHSFGDASPPIFQNSSSTTNQENHQILNSPHPNLMATIKTEPFQIPKPML